MSLYDEARRRRIFSSFLIMQRRLQLTRRELTVDVTNVFGSGRAMRNHFKAYIKLFSIRCSMMNFSNNLSLLQISIHITRAIIVISIEQI